MSYIKIYFLKLIICFKDIRKINQYVWTIKNLYFVNLLLLLLDGNEGDSATADSAVFIDLNRFSLDAITGSITKTFFPKIESITLKDIIIKTFTQII